MATALVVPAARTTAPTRPPLTPATVRPHTGPAQPAWPPSAGVARPAWPPPSRARDATDAELATHRFAVVCLEVLNGFRPLAHLRRLVEPRGFDAAAAGIQGRRTVRAHDHPGAPRAAMVQIRRIRVCEPAQGVAEASIVFSREGLAWSMAIRLERRHQRWLCTVAHTLR